MTQRTFADLNWEQKEKKTRRERFLGEMELVVPWKELVKLIAPVAPRCKPGATGGRPAYPVEVMLRIYLCQTWYNLSDDGMEDTLYDSESVRRFCLGQSSVDAVPDERSIRRFRHLLETENLQEKLMQRVTRLFSDKGIMTKSGTIVDATIIHAPTSTKNESKQRDPEMSHTKKGNQYYFGMKCHVGVDAESGIVHTARRAIGEHPFHVIKNIFRYTKVRYRGILKNSLHLQTLCMLASLYLKRKVLMAQQG